ncbi:MAG TPA: glycine cleavage system aminomethyltransferase GcvT [Euryarchaeota archaeon]|nr:glycine cleavage system aminomethyltransferase GcvT [Euryarchaeota archaeon]
MEVRKLPRRTPLYDRHASLGAKFIEFAGWEMPVQYTSIIEEHLSVRNSAGIFDVSHMARIIVSDEYEDVLSKLLTNDVKGMKDYKLKYNLMLREDGTIIDDMIVYKLPGKLIIVPNAGNDEIIASWINKHAGEEIAEIVTEKYAMVAIQGPKSQEILQKISECDLSGIKFFRCAECKIAGVESIISRSGYTGEDGFEIIMPSEDAVKIWNLILEAGGRDIKPCGLGARDTLRLEMGFALAGNEFAGGRTPLEARLDFVIDWDHDFIGKEALLEKKDKIDELLMGIVLESKAIPRHGFEVYKGDKYIGKVSSGGYSPILQKSIALAYIKKEEAHEGNDVQVKIRSKSVPGKVVKPPFIKK